MIERGTKIRALTDDSGHNEFGYPEGVGVVSSAEENPGAVEYCMLGEFMVAYPDDDDVYYFKLDEEGVHWERVVDDNV